MQATMMLLPSSLQASLPENTTHDRRPSNCDEKALYGEGIIIPWQILQHACASLAYTGKGQSLFCRV